MDMDMTAGPGNRYRIRPVTTGTKFNLQPSPVVTHARHRGVLEWGRYASRYGSNSAL
jgi:hypothetical protein